MTYWVEIMRDAVSAQMDEFFEEYNGEDGWLAAVLNEKGKTNKGGIGIRRKPGDIWPLSYWLDLAFSDPFVFPRSFDLPAFWPQAVYAFDDLVIYARYFTDEIL